ncbi:hypothetical protein [Vibrio algivorus]|uniref:Uncharacterized protein n=1 Tax=Vibrio algivorus TaxID=1667024 RepID=A0A557PEJ2_9VIBR|nr:hypothetical protein [Vibrio algivorus]TVO39056.1 hypothetical protein FOF44_03085 [Vibrio algivorus]
MYILGVLISFMFWCYDLCSAVFLNKLRNQTFILNLNKIGKTMCPVTCTIEARSSEITGLPKATMIIFSSLIGLLAIPFSWFHVAFVLIRRFNRNSKRKALPQNVRDAVWRLHNMDMNLEDVIKAMATIKSGGDLSNFEEIREEIIDDLKFRGHYEIQAP